MNTPIKIKEPLVERLDFHKERLGFTRQGLANNLLRIALGILDAQGYEKLLKLPAGKELNAKRKLDSDRQEPCSSPSQG